MFSNNSFLFSVVFLLQNLAGLSIGYDDFNNVCQEMWREDRNRASMYRYYRVEKQSRIYDASSNVDRAYSPLFKYLDASTLNKPTYKSFLALLDNYHRFVGQIEVMTSQETEETWTFLREISLTGPIRVLHQYLAKRGMASTSMGNFLQDLFKMWFYRYKRQSYRDSSGFEHVFVGEISRGVVSGFHNWLQFYRLEKNNEVDYRGYFKYYSSEPARMKFQMFWGNYKKFITSMFLGTSPEFEIALYTLCFIVEPGKSCQCKINGQDIRIASHKYDRRFVGTAYLNI